MARPTNPEASSYTVRIPRELVPFIHARSTELGLSQAVYVQSLINSDRVNRRKPALIYPSDYSGPALELRVAETPPPHLRSGK
jgi:hypothetical protein